MKNKLLILIAVLVLSCSKEDSNTLMDKTELQLVTGINCRQTADDTPQILGNPNVLVNNKFSLYPNPAKEIFLIKAPQNVTDVWVVPATPQKSYQDTDFSSILTPGLYSETSISSHSALSLNEQSSGLINMTISSLAKGYYKVFVKIDGVIYWDNLYKYENEGDTIEQFDALSNYWN